MKLKNKLVSRINDVTKKLDIFHSATNIVCIQIANIWTWNKVYYVDYKLHRKIKKIMVLNTFHLGQVSLV